jgi:molybdate transport system permease protein
VSRRGRALPAVLLVPAAVAGLLLAAPLAGLLARAPWDRVLPQLRSAAVLQALWLSLHCSAAAAALSLLLGLPLAAWLASARGRSVTLVRVLVTLPMVLPPVVGGVALLLAFGRNGLLGGPLGLELPFSVAGVILAETFVAMPFLVLTVEGGLRALDPRHADAAATLGASPWRAFRTVTLPMLAPSIRAGLLLAWARALGEFGATITFAGNLAGRTRTMPLAVYVALESDPDAAVVLSLLLVLVSATVLWALRRQWFPLR